MDNHCTASVTHVCARGDVRRKTTRGRREGGRYRISGRPKAHILDGYKPLSE